MKEIRELQKSHQYSHTRPNLNNPTMQFHLIHMNEVLFSRIICSPRGTYALTYIALKVPRASCSPFNMFVCFLPLQDLQQHCLLLAQTVAQFVDALRYEPEGHGFETQ
jgi:hypothetical protein